MIEMGNEESLFVNRYFYIGNQRKINDKYRISISSSTLLDISSTNKNQLRKYNKWKYFYYLPGFWILMDQSKQCQQSFVTFWNWQQRQQWQQSFVTFWNLKRIKKVQCFVEALQHS